ncbi:MAG: glycosyltransferase [Candidatus Omnitrophica bacterium]|nr:glycosyltransferase [Candidatus Omnitrophota bacterium]
MKKHFVFLRNPPKELVWGGLEKLVCEWFEHINYKQCRVSFVVGPGWRETYVKAFAARNLSIHVVETNLDQSMSAFKKFLGMYGLLQKLHADTCIFVQGRFLCFHFVHILAAWFVCWGRVYIHENLGAPKPYPRKSRKHFGFIPGLALWWYAQRAQTRLRAYFSKSTLAVSGGVKESLVNGWGYPEEKVLVSFHGIDLEQFFPSPDSFLEIRKRLDIDVESKVIIVSARLSPEKCINRAIDAFDELADFDKTLELFILGSGPLENQLKDLALRKKTRDRIKFFGHVDNVAEYLKAGNYFILSSDNEGLGLSFLEAMASGLVCITTRCPGAMEIIQDGVNGFFAEKTSQGVREALQKALALTPLQHQLVVDNGVNLVRMKFGLNNIRKTFSILGVPYA